VQAQAGRKAQVWWSKSREEPDAHKQRHPINQDQIRTFGENRVDTIFGAGLLPCSFFRRQVLFFGMMFFRKACTDPHRYRDCATMASPNLIERSFELASERCEDLTPLVYQRLFREYPQTRALFRSEGSELVKGSMLALAIDAILDFAGERIGTFRMIECEVSSHDAYGTPPELFVAFYAVLAQTLREIVDVDWSPDIDAAWRNLLEEIEYVVARSAA
jgi:hemoglobin-like flavoprotein